MRVRQSIHPLTLLTVLVATLVLGVACDGDGPDEAAEAQPANVSRGILTASFNRYIDTASDEPFEQFSLMGVFVRHGRDHDHTVESLFDSPISDIDLALDSCTVPARVLDDNRVRTLPGDSSIELLDVGDLSLSVNSVPVLIPTRTFPDLLKVIVGVIYTADETQDVIFRPGETYDLQASGGDDIARFRVALDAPLDLGDVKVAGVAPGEQVPLLRRGAPIELIWSGDSFGDEVIVVLSWMSMGAPWSMTCRARDDGRFVIPAAYTADLPDPLTCSDQELTLSRVRQVAFRSGGLSTGSFQFFVSTDFPVTF
jgi:hypothetical protein